MSDGASADVDESKNSPHPPVTAARVVPDFTDWADPYTFLRAL